MRERREASAGGGLAEQSAGGLPTHAAKPLASRPPRTFRTSPPPARLAATILGGCSEVAGEAAEVHGVHDDVCDDWRHEVSGCGVESAEQEAGGKREERPGQQLAPGYQVRERGTRSSPRRGPPGAGVRRGRTLPQQSHSTTPGRGSRGSRVGRSRRPAPARAPGPSGCARSAARSPRPPPSRRESEQPDRATSGRCRRPRRDEQALALESHAARAPLHPERPRRRPGPVHQRVGRLHPSNPLRAPRSVALTPAVDPR